MKLLRTLAAVLVGPAMVCSAAPPSEQTINELLDVSGAQKAVAAMVQQMDMGMKLGMQQALQGRTLTTEQQAAADKLLVQMGATMKEELSLDKLRPVYVQAYREIFSQEEVDGLISFYKSAAGKALIEKVPQVMQRAGALTQERIEPILKKMGKTQQDFLKELNTPR
jgi:hypothetical protein